MLVSNFPLLSLALVAALHTPFPMSKTSSYPQRLGCSAVSTALTRI